MTAKRNDVSVVMTVRNDGPGCVVTLNSLATQTRSPDEIIVVDGGSTDDTPAVIRGFAASNPRIRWIEASGANISQGRNIGTKAANSEIIATTDAGCHAAPDWLEKLVQPFEEDPQTEFVAGVYRIEAHSLLEEVVGLATMRGQLDPFDPVAFNPSARSLAYTKSLWERVGGWPDWIQFSEDTLFDHKVRQTTAGRRFAGDAVVSWRPRSSVAAIARQFYNYGTGRGHTQIGAADFSYNLRNFGLVFVALAFCVATAWAVPIVGAMLAYFYVWTFHAKAVRIARWTNRRAAYPVCMCVMWVVMASGMSGYVAGSWERWRNQARYRKRIEAYLSTA